MDILTFISEIIRTLAWPIVVLIIFITLRNPLSRVISLLDRMKYKDLELEFGRKMEELAKEAKKELPKLVKTDKAKEHLYDLAKVSPRSAILEAWLLVEEAAISKIEKKKVKISAATKKSPLGLAQTLANNNILDDQKQQIFNKLRNLRNTSVHASELSFDEDLAVEYIDTAMRMVSFLKE